MKERVITIQKTSKDIKRKWLTGFLLTFGGFLSMIILAPLVGAIINQTCGAIVLVAALVMMIIGPIQMVAAHAQKWWNHE